jgi:DNA-binding transcriptional regulator YiaG
MNGHRDTEPDASAAASRAITPAEIRLILAATDLTRAQLGKVLSVHRVTVQYWCSGRQGCNPSHTRALRALAEASATTPRDGEAR